MKRIRKKSDIFEKRKKKNGRPRYLRRIIGLTSLLPSAVRQPLLIPPNFNTSVSRLAPNYMLAVNYWRFSASDQ